MTLNPRGHYDEPPLQLLIDPHSGESVDVCCDAVHLAISFEYCASALPHFGLIELSVLRPCGSIASVDCSDSKVVMLPCLRNLPKRSAMVSLAAAHGPRASSPMSHFRTPSGRRFEVSFGKRGGVL